MCHGGLSLWAHYASPPLMLTSPPPSNVEPLPFCVKIWSALGIQWVGVLAFEENYSEICRATHILSAVKNVAQRLYW